MRCTRTVIQHRTSLSPFLRDPARPSAPLRAPTHRPAPASCRRQPLSILPSARVAAGQLLIKRCPETRGRDSLTEFKRVRVRHAGRRVHCYYYGVVASETTVYNRAMSEILRESISKSCTRQDIQTRVYCRHVRRDDVRCEKKF